jgi:hypothetical protein
MSTFTSSGHKPIRTAVLSAAVLLCVAASACKDTSTVWSTEARSPDGRWVATAHTDQNSGPGTASIESTVSIRPVTGRRGEIEILELWQDTTAIDLKLNWLTPSHLEITYRKPETVDFQAITCCGGIEISTRDLSATPSDTSARR